MGKTKELATKDETPLANAIPYDFTFDGEDESDMEMPYACIHQGDLSEGALGEHKKGSLINTLTKEKIEGRKFIPIRAWKTYKIMGNNGIVELVTNNKNEVPVGALEWTDGQPPKAQVFRRFLVIFEGEDLPCILSFRGYGKPATAAKTIATLQKIRGSRGPGMFEFNVVESQNDKGKWFDPDIKPPVDPTPELMELAARFAPLAEKAQSQKHDGDHAAVDTRDPDSTPPF